MDSNNIELIEENDSKRKWIFLNEESKEKLNATYPGLLKIRSGDHVTLESPLKDESNLYAAVKFKVVGYAKDDKAEVVVVKLPKEIKSDNKIPHVTISVSKGVDPKYSNELLEKGFEKIEPIELVGTINVQELTWEERQEQKKLNIAYIIPRFYPFKGGAEQNIYALASRMVEEGHDVTVITTDVKYRSEALPKEEMYNGIKIVRHHAFSEALYAGFYPSLLPYLLSHKFDVIHVSGIGFAWREFCLIIKKIFSRKTKFVATPQGQFMALNDQTGFRGFAKKYYTKSLRLYLNWLFNIFIQVNPKQKTWMVEEYGIKSEKVRLIPNGIDENYLETKLVEHSKEDKVVITYMNRMEYYKGIQDVIQALYNIITEDKYKSAKLPDFGFKIMGRTGNYTPKLKELVEKLNMQDFVEFVFAPTDEERDQIFYSESQIDILPSKWEATGITLIEAMAKGNALITTYQNEAAYLLIKENLNGFIYNFGDVNALSDILFKLLTDHRLLQSMREYNIEFAKNFTWESVFPNYDKLIHEITSK